MMYDIAILSALDEHRPKATYGVPLRQRVSELVGRDVSYGTLYLRLQRLEEQGYVHSWRGETTPERGELSKRYFKRTNKPYDM